MMSQNKRKALKAKGWVICNTPEQLFAELEKQNQKGGVKWVRIRKTERRTR